jgi:site-specific recombinase XerD
LFFPGPRISFFFVHLFRIIWNEVMTVGKNSLSQKRPCAQEPSEAENGRKGLRKRENHSEVATGWAEALQEMLRIKRGLSDFTRRDYRRLVSQFYSMSGVEFGRNEADFADAFFQAGAIKQRTRNNRIAYLMAFWNFCVERGWLGDLPVPKKWYKKKSVVPDQFWLKPEQRSALLDSFRSLTTRRDSWAALRDYAMVLVALSSGVRTSELRALKKEDFDFDSNVIRLSAEITKTSRPRHVPFVESRARKAVAEVIDWYERLFGKNHEGPLFCTETGEKMSQENFLRRFNRVAKRINPKLTPYKLRHVFAVLSLSQQKVPINILQETMGHASITTTAQYLHSDPDRILAAYEGASFLGKTGEVDPPCSGQLRYGRRLHKTA